MIAVVTFYPLSSLLFSAQGELSLSAGWGREGTLRHDCIQRFRAAGDGREERGGREGEAKADNIPSLCTHK